MEKLQEIKDQVAQEWGHTDWNDFGESFKHRLGSAHAERDDVMTEIARRYAKAVADDALKRAAENATLWVETPINGTEFKTVTKELGDGYDETITVFKDRILSTEINIDL